MRGPKNIILPGDPKFDAVARKIGVAVVENRVIPPGDLSTVNNIVEPPVGPLLINLDPDPGFRREWDVRFPIPLRSEVEVLSADSSKDRAIGWTMHENIGIGAFNPRGVTSLKVEKVPCPVCGEKVVDLHLHASGIEDLEHGVLSVMTS